jgi:ribonuclease P/MRP protein subunit POP8
MAESDQNMLDPAEQEEVDQGDSSMADVSNGKQKLLKITKGHEITSRTIKTPTFSYICLQLISDPPSSNANLDELTVRSYLTAALTQFLGITGSAIAVDILKVAERECWLRVPREDASAVIAAVGGWIGGGDGDRKIGWKVRESGNWLGSLVGKRNLDKAWSG